jgi:short-subunit dehydrogenase
MESKRSAPRTALVTGASSGIGFELAKFAAADGCNVVLVARSRDKLEDLAKELRAAHGVEARVLAEDLAVPGAPTEICDELARDGVSVDILVNNAGYATWGPFVALGLEGELAMLAVNVVALTHLTKLFAPPMVHRGSGRILNVASTAAFQPGPLMAVYYASKAYVLSFSEALAAELAGTGVTVTALCPGPTRSGFQARAGIRGARLFSGMVAMHDSAAVARAGWRAMQRRRRVVVPGVMNRVMVQAGRVAPRRLVTAIAHRLNRAPAQGRGA